MMKLSYARRSLVRPFAEGMARVIVRTGITPNALTVLGFLTSVGAAIVIATGHIAIGGVVVLVSGLFDLLDGSVARLTNRVTRFGALLDSTLDRFSEIAILLALLVLCLEQYSSVEVFLVFIVLVGGILVSYVRARAEGLGISCDVGLFTRPERVIVLAIGLLANQVVIVLWILAVMTHVTVAQRIIHAWRQVRGE